MSRSAGRLDAEFGHASAELVTELTRRVSAIEHGYRAVARQIGLLYICADQHDLPALTRSLDRPMRNAADNEHAIGAILEALRLAADGQP